MKKDRTPALYQRPNSSVWWCYFWDLEGKRQFRSTKVPLENRKKAEKVLEILVERLKASHALGVTVAQPLTVSLFADKWIARRRELKIASAGDDAARLKHAMPFIGEMLLADVRPKHILDMVERLKARIGTEKKDLSSRQVRHVYFTLKSMFGDAIEREVTDLNPCALKKGKLPGKDDKHDDWRQNAVFSRSEVETIISHENIPEHRRVRYAGLFLSGVRIGELAARRWRDYDQVVEPLGKLQVATSYNRKQDRVKSTKAKRARRVPVHPVLAKVLAGWKLGGWERFMGRPPTEDDLIFPSAHGGHLHDPVVLGEFHEDLAGLSMRLRRIHDTRRTFTSLMRTDGAPVDMVKLITHGPSGDIIDDYTTMPWEPFCEAVLRLKVSLREGRLMQLPKAVGAPLSPAHIENVSVRNTERPDERLLHCLLHSDPNSNNRDGLDDGRGGTRSRRKDEPKTPRGATEERDQGPAEEPKAVHRHPPEPQCHSVTVPVAALLSVARELLEEHRRSDRHATPCDLCDRAEKAIAAVEGAL